MKPILFTIAFTLMLTVTTLLTHALEDPKAAKATGATPPVSNIKAQYITLYKLDPAAKETYRRYFSKMIRRNNPAWDEQISKAIECGIAGTGQEQQMQYIDKLVKAGVYAEIRAELKKKDPDVAYVMKLADCISGVEKRRANLVDNPEEFIATPKNLLARIEKQDNSAANEYLQFMDDLFAMSFAYELSEFSANRDNMMAEEMNLKLLEAQLYFETIRHNIKNGDAGFITKEFSRDPKDINIEAILGATLKAYPKVIKYYQTAKERGRIKETK